MVNKKIDLLRNKELSDKFYAVLGQQWDLPVSKDGCFPFISNLKISQSDLTLKTSITLWKVNAPFPYQEDYKEKFLQMV